VFIKSKESVGVGEEYACVEDVSSRQSAALLVGDVL
jgi:hypothetical protein